MRSEMNDHTNELRRKEMTGMKKKGSNRKMKSYWNE
jgi:hypothetical protein